MKHIVLGAISSLLAVASVNAAALSPRCDWGAVTKRDVIDVSLSKRCVAVFNRTSFTQYFAFGEAYTDLGFRVANGANSAETGSANAGGPNWIAYLSDTYSNAGTKRRSLAQAGSVVNSTFPLTTTSGIDDFITQTTADWKSTFVPPPSNYPFSLSSSLFFVWFGAVDINKKVDGTAYGSKATTQLSLDTYFAQLDIMRTSGATAFVLINTTPFPRFPFLNGDPLNAARLSDIQDWNVQLSRRAWAYSQKWSIPVLVYDAFTLYTNLLNNPTNYGFVDNTTIYSSGNISQYMWGTSMLATTTVHKYMAADLSAFLTLNSV